jgi:hypothetical protein
MLLTPLKWHFGTSLFMSFKHRMRKLLWNFNGKLLLGLFLCMLQDSFMLNSSLLLSTSSGFEFLKMFSCFFSLLTSRYSFLRINKKNFLVKSWREKGENRPDVASGARPFVETWWIWVYRESLLGSFNATWKVHECSWRVQDSLERLNNSRPHQKGCSLPRHSKTSFSKSEAAKVLSGLNLLDVKFFSKIH